MKVSLPLQVLITQPLGSVYEGLHLPCIIASSDKLEPIRRECCSRDAMIVPLLLQVTASCLNTHRKGTGWMYNRAFTCLGIISSRDKVEPIR